MVSRFDKIRINPDETIGHALTTRILTVPPNQREFSWKDKHVDDLYRDFDSAIKGNAAEYFLGSIVVINSGDERMQVVDGQQRLATSLILLAAIRDYFLKNPIPGVDAAGFQKQYIFSEHYLRPDQKDPHLYLNDRDREHFYRRILLPPTDPLRQAAEAPAKKSAPRAPLSHKLIDKAAAIAAKKVTEILEKITSGDQKAVVLNSWVDFLLKKARVIWVEVPDESSAYLIFETMNDRGLELSASDLIKNYLFGKAGNEAKLQTIKLNWSSMVSVLNTAPKTTEVKDFVRHYWVSRNGVTRSQDLFEAIRKNIKNDAEAVDTSEKLAQSAAMYVALLTSGHSTWSSYPEPVRVRKAIATLSILGVEQLRPVLLAAMEHLSPKELTKLLIMAISWTVRLLISGTQGSGAVETVYGNAAFGITEGKYRSASEIAVPILRQIPQDSAFEASFSEANVSKSSLAKYYLRALENQEDGKAEPYLAAEEELDMNVEHIMPDKRTDDWTHIPVETHEEYVNRLGNQAIMYVKDNSKVGTRGYDIKKPELKASKFKLTKDAGKYDVWEAKEIDLRQKELARIAVKTWPLKK